MYQDHELLLMNVHHLHFKIEFKMCVNLFFLYFCYTFHISICLICLFLFGIHRMKIKYVVIYDNLSRLSSSTSFVLYFDSNSMGRIYDKLHVELISIKLNVDYLKELRVRIIVFVNDELQVIFHKLIDIICNWII
jgi:hypothetical protein